METVNVKMLEGITTSAKTAYVMTEMHVSTHHMTVGATTRDHHIAINTKITGTMQAKVPTQILANRATPDFPPP